MPDILTLLSCFIFDLNNTSIKQMACVIQGMLTTSGRVTMLAISRWTGKGGTYRTVQRFFHRPKNWPTLIWVFFHTHCFSSPETYAFAGDEVVTSKSGAQTYGVDWFFSSLANRRVKGLAFLALSLVGLNQRQSLALNVVIILKTNLKTQEQDQLN